MGRVSATLPQNPVQRIDLQVAVADFVTFIAQTKAARVAVITHGGLLTLLLHHFDSGYGFAEWQRLTTPDLFEVDWQSSGVRRLGRAGLFG